MILISEIICDNDYQSLLVIIMIMVIMKKIYFSIFFFNFLTHHQMMNITQVIRLHLLQLKKKIGCMSLSLSLSKIEGRWPNRLVISRSR